MKNKKNIRRNTNCTSDNPQHYQIFFILSLFYCSTPIVSFRCRYSLSCIFVSGVTKHGAVTMTFYCIWHTRSRLPVISNGPPHHLTCRSSSSVLKARFDCRTISCCSPSEGASLTGTSSSSSASALWYTLIDIETCVIILLTWKQRRNSEKTRPSIRTSSVLLSGLHSPQHRVAYVHNAPFCVRAFYIVLLRIKANGLHTIHRWHVQQNDHTLWLYGYCNINPSWYLHGVLHHIT